LANELVVMANGTGDTVNVVLPAIPLSVAEMLVLPALTPVASPPLVMVVTPVLEEVQVTDPVRFWVLPSEYVPVAVNCWVPPAVIVGLAGVTVIDDNVTTVEMVRLSTLVALWAGLPESVTRTVKLNAPLTVGIPEIIPPPLSVTPAGSVPLASDQVYGVTPPLAVNVAE
jgi:hypothetical protein